MNWRAPLTASNNSRLFSKYQLGLSYGRPVQSLEIVLSVVWMHSGFFVGAGVASAALRPWFGTHVRGLEREGLLAPHVECCERSAFVNGPLPCWRPATRAGRLSENLI